MKLKTAIVTGAYGKIGKAIAEKIALQSNYRVVLVGRDELNLINTASSIIKTTGNSLIEYKVVDLSSKSSIIDLANNWYEPLHLLINNAATTPRSRLETEDGIEMQFATNVLGYMWMMKFMSVHMKIAEDARIVNVASYWAGGLDLNDIEFKNRRYNNDSAYRQSKQADRMLSKAFSRLLLADGIMVNSCHPGDVNSKLSNNLGYGGSESPSQGAETPAWVALSNDLFNVTGEYFEHKQKVHCSFSANNEEVQNLYDLCLSY